MVFVFGRPVIAGRRVNYVTPPQVSTKGERMLIGLQTQSGLPAMSGEGSPLDNDKCVFRQVWFNGRMCSFSSGMWGWGALSPHAVVPRSLIVLCCFVCVDKFWFWEVVCSYPWGLWGRCPPHAVSPQFESFWSSVCRHLAQLSERLDF